MATLFTTKRMLLPLLALARSLAQQQPEIQAEPRALRGAARTAHHAAAQVAPCDADWVIASDADVEALQGCRSVQSLTIQSTDVTSVTSLAGLGSLETAGDVVIAENKFLKSLVGLESLTRVGALVIRTNRRLASLLALQSLQNITGDLVIEDNAKLPSLAGPQNLQIITGDLLIVGNHKLLSLEGLQGLQTARSVKIDNNDKLALLALHGLQTITADLTIWNNDELPSLDGLQSLRSVQNVEIDNNDKLLSLVALQGLQTITGQLVIQDNPELPLLDGLQNLQSAQTVEIKGNSKLSSLLALQGLQTITEELIISSNNELSSLAGLNPETLMKLTISSNDKLHSLSGLEGLQMFPNLDIRYNDQLTSLDGLPSFESAKSVKISGNKALSSLYGLHTLKSAEAVEIESNDQLRSLSGLQNLQTITGRLLLKSNDELTSLDGLQSLESAQVVQIWTDDTLSSLWGLQSLRNLSELELQNCPAFTSFDGLQNLTRLDVLYVRNLLGLGSLAGLESLKEVGELTLDLVKGLTSLSALRGLRSAKTVNILGADSLQSLAGLATSFTSIGTLHLERTPLTSLSGLEGLTSIGTLFLSENGGLLSLSGLENLATVDVLEISFNGALLSVAALQNLKSVETLRIRYCHGLSTLTGLEGITHVSTLELSECNGLQSPAGLDGLTSVGSLELEGEFTSLTGLDNLRTADVIEIKLTHTLLDLIGLGSLTSVGEFVLKWLYALNNLGGLSSLVNVTRLVIEGNDGLLHLIGLETIVNIGDLEITQNDRLRNLNGLDNLVNVAGGLTIDRNAQLADITALGQLQRVQLGLTISQNERLKSLDGLQRLTHVRELSLRDLVRLQSVSALGALTNAWNGVFIESCPQLQSLEGLGALVKAVQLNVQGTELDYLGAPFGAHASAGAIRFDQGSWPSCVTAQEHASLASVIVGSPDLSTLPEVTMSTQWLPHQTRPCQRPDFGTFSCTRGHPCNFSLAGRLDDYTSVFISGLHTGCGACLESHVQGDVMEDGLVDLGYALANEDGGLRSICRCAGGSARGPVAQLLLRGPYLQNSVTVCWSGGPCMIKVDGEALEPTDHVVLMNNCSQGDPSSGFAVQWAAENLYSLDNMSTWGSAQPTRYQVCWRPPCSFTVDGPTCPAPEDRYIRIGEVELNGVSRRSYKVVLGNTFWAPNIGFGVADGDHMRLRRACGEANEAGIDLLDTNSSGMVFDFGRLTGERVRAGSLQLCWCKERVGVPCNADWHFTAVSGDVLIVCPAGQEPADGNPGRCQACPAGREKLEDGQAACTDCPAGRFSPGGDEGCRACKEGTYAEESGSSSCTACLARENAGVEAATCSEDPLMLILLASLNLFVAVLCATLVCTIRRQLPVVDVSLDQHHTVVTTLRPHGFSKFGLVTFPATLVGTSHPGLDKQPEPFRCRVKDAVRLELLTFKGDSIDRRLDTSKGYLVVPFPHDLYHQGWPVSVAYSLPVLFIVVIALGALVFWRGVISEGLLGAAAAALASTAASAAFRWRPRTTPLQKRCSEYTLELESGLRRTRRTKSKGPDRALAIGKLHHLLAFFRDFIRDRTAYYLESNILRPVTGKEQLSFAELVGAGPVEWFVSHFWGTPFEHFCTALGKHATLVCGGRDWKSLRYWICFCSNNQYHIKEELGNGWAESSFYITLRSGLCHGTCMVLDDQALPLTRVWCIFELLQTILLERTEKIFEGLLFCTASGVLNTGSGSVEVAMELARKVAEMDLATAQASNENDADMIRAQVKIEMGSFDALNHFIRSEVRKVLTRAQSSANEQFAEVLAILDGEEVEFN